jgi:hypothetical protein
MYQTLAADPNAIGVLPAGWLNDSVTGLTVRGDNTTPISLPILAAAHTEPDESLSRWLACIQNALP